MSTFLNARDQLYSMRTAGLESCAPTYNTTTRTVHVFKDTAGGGGRDQSRTGRHTLTENTQRTRYRSRNATVW